MDPVESGIFFGVEALCFEKFHAVLPHLGIWNKLIIYVLRWVNVSHRRFTRPRGRRNLYLVIESIPVGTLKAN